MAVGVGWLPPTKFRPPTWPAKCTRPSGNKTFKPGRGHRSHGAQGRDEASRPRQHTPAPNSERETRLLFFKLESSVRFFSGGVRTTRLRTCWAYPFHAQILTTPKRTPGAHGLCSMLPDINKLLLAAVSTLSSLSRQSQPSSASRMLVRACSKMFQHAPRRRSGRGHHLMSTQSWMAGLPAGSCPPRRGRSAAHGHSHRGTPLMGPPTRVNAAHRACPV